MRGHVRELVVTIGSRRRRIVAYDCASAGPLCVACAIDHFGESLILDPLGKQSASYTPVFADDRKAMAQLRGEVCYGTLPPADHKAVRK